MNVSEERPVVFNVFKYLDRKDNIETVFGKFRGRHVIVNCLFEITPARSRLPVDARISPKIQFSLKLRDSGQITNRYRGRQSDGVVRFAPSDVEDREVF